MGGQSPGSDNRDPPPSNLIGPEDLSDLTWARLPLSGCCFIIDMAEMAR